MGLWACQPGTSCSPDWPELDRFRQDFIRTDGRVVDPANSRQHSTSEGQAYALFFSLIANQRALFETLLAWTGTHLADGHLGEKLPAWEWAESEPGKGAILDPNPASDADLWLSYTLIEAGRLWSVPAYTEVGQALARQILAEETDQLPRLGRTLLPGREGFHPSPERWCLNPSYSPPFLIAALAAKTDEPAWQEIHRSSLQVLSATQHGFAGDWLLYTAPNRFEPDPGSAFRGSYDAIRVYLWVGMTSPLDTTRAGLIERLGGMRRQLGETQTAPESVDLRTGLAEAEGPRGFAMALVPFLIASGQSAASQALLQRIQSKQAEPRDLTYYSQALSLFSQGFSDGRFGFDSDGTLRTRWSGSCD